MFLFHCLTFFTIPRNQTSHFMNSFELQLQNRLFLVQIITKLLKCGQCITEGVKNCSVQERTNPSSFITSCSYSCFDCIHLVWEQVSEIGTCQKITKLLLLLIPAYFVNDLRVPVTVCSSCMSSITPQ